MRSKKMNGPTSRRFAVGSARRTAKPPMSLELGMTISSMASQAKLSPGLGSLPGKKLMGGSLAEDRTVSPEAAYGTIGACGTKCLAAHCRRAPPGDLMTIEHGETAAERRTRFG